jgi:transcriptional regulator with XRE-family HTH domain
MTIGEKIHKLRKEKGWSQNQLAQKIDINTRNISLYESGKAVPSSETVQKLANLFNVSTDYLFNDEPENIASTGIKDKSLIPLFEEIDNMNMEEKNAVRVFVEAIAFKRKVKSLENRGVFAAFPVNPSPSISPPGKARAPVTA